MLMERVKPERQAQKAETAGTASEAKFVLVRVQERPRTEERAGAGVMPDHAVE